MSHREQLASTMPAMLRHEGVWHGIYRHLDVDGQMVDQHRSVVRCEFPEHGEYAYVQHNHFIWDDGREQHDTLFGVLRDNRLWWNNERFVGYAWSTADDVILLNLERKDEPGASFVEIIALAPDGQSRARTWHWFTSSGLIRRTLCDEVLQTK